MKKTDFNPNISSKSLNLEKEWYIEKDPENIGKSSCWEKYVQRDAVSAHVPSIIQEFFPEYHGAAYYWCKFSSDIEIDKGERVILRFGGVDYFAEVWLNSVYLGSYEGGETPFSFDVTDALKESEENLLAVRVINPCDRDIDGFNLMNTPHRNKVIKKRAGSNLNHGGIWYGVSLSVVPKVYIDDAFLTGNIRNGEITVKLSAVSKAVAGTSAHLTVSVYENKEYTSKVTEKHFDYNALNGENELAFKITVPNHKLWSTDDPNLYRVEFELESEYGKHTHFVKFGFREFAVKDGFFYLNGKKIFLKSSHSGNAFPKGQMFPTKPEEIRRDFIYAKSSGFNTLRAIAGLFRPEQLDLADEIGLLIYEECFASWCMARSERETWKNSEEFEENVNKKYQDMPVIDENVMLERWIGATEKMILRDRNHPSIVIWGLLNETKNNNVFRIARDFLPRARELDPSRLIVLNSGRFDFDMSIGSASNPYVNKWENTWGVDGHPELFNSNDPYKSTSDNHFYASVPLSKENAAFYRTMGHNTPLPMFLSEFGIGSLFHVIEEYKHFVQNGERLDLEDSSWLKYQSDAFSEDFYKFGVDKLFPFPEALLKESQRINADERKRVYDIIRSNPRLAGYSLTGLMDHGMCGEGLWSYFRRWKPEMFDAVSEGHASLRFCLFAEPAVFAGEEFEIEAVLANEGILKSGTYTADLAIVSDLGVVETFTETFDLNADDFATPIMKRKISLKVPEGKYKLTASLREGSPAAASTDFFVYKKRRKLKANAPIYAVGFSSEELSNLKDIAPEIKEYNGEDAGVIIAGRVSAEQISKLIAVSDKGAKVLFAERSIFFDEASANAIKELDETLIFRNEYDWLYHKEFALLSREIFDGINDKLAPLTKFGPVFSQSYGFKTEKTPDFVLCPSFITGYHGVDMSYNSMHGMLGYKHGKGEIYLNTFKIIDNLYHPIANVILYNFIKYLSK